MRAEVSGTEHFCLAVLHCHSADVLNIHRAEDQVVHSCVGAPYYVMFIMAFEIDMLVANRSSSKCTSPANAHCRVCVHVVFVVLIFSDAC